MVHAAELVFLRKSPMLDEAGHVELGALADGTPVLIVLAREIVDGLALRPSLLEVVIDQIRPQLERAATRVWSDHASHEGEARVARWHRGSDKIQCYKLTLVLADF